MNTDSSKKQPLSFKDTLLYTFCVAVMAFCVVAVFVSFSKSNAKKTKANSSTAPSSKQQMVLVDPTSDEEYKFWDGIEVSETATTVVEEENMPSSAQLDIECISQYPELPSGCESVALTMMLNYYGFNLDKTTIADNYLIYSDDNFVMGFKGNPRTGSGGAYAPSMANTANRFFIQQESKLRAIDITGTELEELFPYIAGGTPVMVWTTIQLNPAKASGTVFLYGSTEFQWVSNEHCVVLKSYDIDANTITICDSIDGEVTYSIEEFKTVYDSMWKMAIIIQ